MILYIVTETDEKYRSGTGWGKIKWTLEKHARDCCLVLHFSQVTRKLIKELAPWAICHSGGGTPHDTYDVLTHSAYRWLIRSCDIPQIGFCGGHQIIAQHHDGAIDTMRELEPGEPDLNPEYFPGQYKEWGVFPVQIVKPDPLFRGLPKTIMVQERHRQEVTVLSDEFEILACTPDCLIQAFVHRRKPVYGVQFHPESGPKTYPHGEKVLRNFFAIARKHRRGQVDAPSR